MKVIPVRSDGAYLKIMNAPFDKKNDVYRYIAPTKVDESQRGNIDRISSDMLWTACEQSIKKSLSCFSENGIELPVQEYLFTILLANAENPYIVLNKGYCGDGGIPGYMILLLNISP